MLFYKALLAVLVSTAVVSALPGLGGGLLNGLTGQLHGALENTPLGNLNIAELIDLEELLGQILEKLEGVKNTGSGAASGVLGTASGVIPEPVSGVVNTVQNTASGAVDTASNMIPTGMVNDVVNTASGAASNVVDAASNAANN
ncbi:hypothetical protein B9Z55_016127 [Caenorhabditis nigoni]|uniref:SXP/RAL-2 family protein Ani s 5-like cation-binding domain-containing protein n=1 Tax=Caenorhabditis nigoni TaxID=1611254 RepID=A0A2G5UDA9_9PELO|nr:hypothetical protein B9Z55_016127 [Caenorhabditis nigoni]